MITYAVELSPDFEAQAELFAAFDEIADKRLTSAVRGSVLTVQGKARATAPVFRGQLRNSITTEVKPIGGSVQGRVFSTIRKPYPYPLVVEYGRKKGARRPPLAPIRRWVHLVIKPPAKALDGIAYVVARNIGRRGIKGRFFLRKAVESSVPKIKTLFQMAIDGIASDMEVG